MKRAITLFLAALALCCACGCHLSGDPGTQPTQTDGYTAPPTTQPEATKVTLLSQPTVIPTEPTTAPTEPPTEPTTAPTEPPTEPTTVSTEPPTEPTTVSTEPPTEPTTVPTEPPTEPTTAPTEPPTEPTTVPTEPPTEPAPLPTEPIQPKDPPSGIKDSSFVRVQDYIPDIVVELRYATTDNFTGKEIYDFQDAYLRYGTVKKLAKVQEALREKGLRLKIWDAFRPTSAQFLLWEAFPDATYVSNPLNGFSSHSKGGTVDITVVDAWGRELEMPSGYDDFSSLADRDYSDCSKEAAANAKMLEKLMTANGFTGYSKEWWHYSDKKSYSVSEVFDPGVVSVWYPNCNEYIGLLVKPDVDSTRLARVYKGKSITLLGWEGRFAFVDYNGTQGYVMSSYIMPDTDQTIGNLLDIVTATGEYTYKTMMADIQALAEKYPEWIRVDSIGKSELGKGLPVLILGDPNAKHQVIIQAAIHGREHMTAWLAMALTEYWAEQDLAGCETVCFHIIPMLNPDGVEISQTASLAGKSLAVYKRDTALGYTSDSKSVYAQVWKANALGVDLNRNFDAGWEKIDDRDEPSAMNYRGTAPFSAAEAKALRDYTLKIDPDVTISYHATGSFIFYEYGNYKKVNALSKSLAEKVSMATGYPLMDDDGTSHGGYKDWCIEDLKIPSLTIEVGCQLAPLDVREVNAMFARNLEVLPIIAQWLESQT